MIRLYNILKSRKRELVYIPLWIYWAILLTLTSLPSTTFIDTFRFSDKIKHFGAYAILGLLLSLASYFQSKWEILSKYFWSGAVIIASVYGMLDEIHQMFIPNRSAEILDWVADFTGAMFGGLIIYLFIRKVNSLIGTK
ncbi:MAG: hypothetical protein D6830_07930 [Ignavibacteria bacterium]|nr:MAG: hypothetical protein D6830_07930 [Ignavibacteria bacterium]